MGVFSTKLADFPLLLLLSEDSSFYIRFTKQEA
jgi:hypothetical protein